MNGMKRDHPLPASDSMQVLSLFMLTMDCVDIYLLPNTALAFLSSNITYILFSFPFSSFMAWHVFAGHSNILRTYVFWLGGGDCCLRTLRLVLSSILVVLCMRWAFLRIYWLPCVNAGVLLKGRGLLAALFAAL